MQSRSTPACRRARGGQGRALRWPQVRPALTAPARGGCKIDGRDGRMACGAAEQKNGRTRFPASVISIMKKSLVHLIRRLMTITGVNLAVAAGIVAAIGDISRFNSPQKLVSYFGLNPRVRQSGLGPAHHGRISKIGRSHARAMLVEAAWTAAKTPGPLHAFFVRIRARRGHQIAAVAVARKLTVLCWHLLTKGEDYLWARPALVANKTRAMELQAGQPARKGNTRGTAYAYNVKALRDAEIELARHAEKAYERFVSHWQRRGTAKQRTGAAIEERR